MSAMRVALICLALGATMLACSSGTANLTWTAVDRDIHGAPLKDVVGYKVYYGRSPRDLRYVVVLSDPRQTTYQVGRLSRGTWYFSVAAYTRDGMQGTVSNVSSKTIK
jgi:hypothetical protein